MTTATANKVKAPKKGFKLDRQMIPTLAAVVIFILMIIMGQALFGTYIRLGFISSLFIDHAYLIILAVAMTLPILTGGIVFVCRCYRGHHRSRRPEAGERRRRPPSWS